MEAPDRIYINGFSAFATVPVKNGIEYIRKDALLELLQEVRAIPHENAITRDLAFQEVVNKLNDM